MDAGNNNQRKSNNMAKYNTMLHDMVAFSHRIQTAGAMLARNAVVASLCVLIRPDVPCPQDMASLLLDYLVQERSPMHFQVYLDFDFYSFLFSKSYYIILIFVLIKTY
eukprot:gb/GECH01010528.1/.p1 GENE.gb/GECH01010528.1/~~gb/GECH01010528.1/.p1  ORF type:complete len:108 (+),score=16.08 gb/GECH01010528.1/:1-324(+)